MRAIEAAGADDIEVWPDMQAAVSLFLSARTQWRWTGAGTALLRTGLDYPSLFAIADRLVVEVTPEVLADLRVLEDAALEVLNRK